MLETILQARVIMAKEDDETIEMDMPPEAARRLLESLDERSEDLDAHSDKFPEPLKVRKNGRQILLKETCATIKQHLVRGRRVSQPNLDIVTRRSLGWAFSYYRSHTLPLLRRPLHPRRF